VNGVVEDLSKENMRIPPLLSPECLVDHKQSRSFMVIPYLGLAGVLTHVSFPACDRVLGRGAGRQRHPG